MVKRTVELFECDICGAEGDRFIVVYSDGQMTLDRCGKHGGRLMKLRDEKGSWVSKAPGARTGFKVSSLDDIKRQREKE